MNMGCIFLVFAHPDSWCLRGPWLRHNLRSPLDLPMRDECLMDPEMTLVSPSCINRWKRIQNFHVTTSLAKRGTLHDKINSTRFSLWNYFLTLMKVCPKKRQLPCIDRCPESESSHVSLWAGPQSSSGTWSWHLSETFQILPSPTISIACCSATNVEKNHVLLDQKRWVIWHPKILPIVVPVEAPCLKFFGSSCHIFAVPPVCWVSCKEGKLS